MKLFQKRSAYQGRGARRRAAGTDSGKYASGGLEGAISAGALTNVVRKGGGLEEGARNPKTRDSDSGKYASGGLEGARSAGALTNVVRKGGSLEEGARKPVGGELGFTCFWVLFLSFFVVYFFLRFLKMGPGKFFGDFISFRG